MALNDITQKILDDARTHVTEIEKETIEEVAVIENENKKRKDQIKLEHDSRVEREAKHQRKQVISHSEQAKKRAVETTKRQHIDSVFADTHQKMIDLDGEKYQKMITSLLQELPENVQGTLHAPSTRMAETKEALQSAGKGDLDIAEDSSLDGGFRISGKTADYDYSFARLIEDARDAHELTIASTLFGETN
ncbi:MAG: V-type ATP synthase subunit E family protein [Candidatus Paceibacterota bacterium]